MQKGSNMLSCWPFDQPSEKERGRERDIERKKEKERGKENAKGKNIDQI